MLIDFSGVAGSYAAYFSPIGRVSLAIAWRGDGHVEEPPDRPHPCDSANPSVHAHLQHFGR